jgi:hypothetical protein
MDVVAAAAHDALVEDAGGLIVVLLEDLLGDLVLGELLVDKVGLRIAGRGGRNNCVRNNPRTLPLRKRLSGIGARDRASRAIVRAKGAGGVDRIGSRCA